MDPLLSSEWKLASSHGDINYTLPTTMVFIGSSDCDLKIEDESVDKKHAIITYDHYQNRYKIKDLGSANGTYLNDRKLPDQVYITLDEGDSIRFGHGSNVLLIERHKRAAEDDMELAHVQQGIKLPPVHNGCNRPKWEQRIPLAECQGCIREQEIHHICDINTDMSSQTYNTGFSESKRDSLVSPLDLRLAHHHSPITTSHHRHPVDATMPEDPIINTHIQKHHGMSSFPNYHKSKKTSPTQKSAVENLPDIFLSPAKRGTPLYGQPSWWGETDADDHNRQLLKDIQRQLEQDKQLQKIAGEERKQATPIKSPTKHISAVETGGDLTKGLSFTVGLENTPTTVEDTSLKPASGEKLSSFLPENLRRSIKERQDRVTLSAEKNSTLEHGNKPARMESPSKSRQSDGSPALKSLSSKIFYSPGDKLTDGAKNPSKSKASAESPNHSPLIRDNGVHHNRSFTMPELVEVVTTAPVMSKSRTLDDGSDSEGDKASDAGTYTIDDDNKELEEARKDIDKVFGITRDSSNEELVNVSASINVSASMNVEVGHSMSPESARPGRPEPRLSNNENGTEVESQVASSSPDLVLIGTSVNDSEVIVGKPPLSPTRLHSRSPEPKPTSPSLVRRSSGRKLPDVPSEDETQTHSNQSSLKKSNSMPRRKKEIEVSKEKILQELGIGDGPMIEQERPKLVEELLKSRTYHKDNDPIIVNKTNFFDKIISTMPETSKELPALSASMTKEKTIPVRASGDSVNTEVLLQSTDEFMKAIHSFSASSQSSSKPQPGSKTTAKQTPLSKSTTDRLNNTIKQNPNSATAATKAAVNARKSLPEAISSRLTYKKEAKDVESKTEDEEVTENKKTAVQKTSSSKSSTSARPNKTVELRRARSDCSDMESPASTPRASTSRSAGKASEISLGAKIVQRARENGAADVTPIKRSDGGRHSLRSSSANKSSAPSTPSATRKQSGRSSTNSLLSKTEKESEKEREKAAWDRRRSYDPRKAAQDAKQPRKSDSRGSTPGSIYDEIVPSRPRANSYGGENSTVVKTGQKIQNGYSNSRHSADTFNSVEANILKLNLAQELEMEDSTHELEIAKVSHNIAKDLELLTREDNDTGAVIGSKKPPVDQSPGTEEIIDSMFSTQQRSSAFSSYRSAMSASPEMSSRCFSPMKKKISNSQNFEEGSPISVDHSYNNLILTSIQQLSAKLQKYTSSTVNRLTEKGVSVSTSPSPIEELETNMPASSELASILKTLKQVEKNFKVMDKALFSNVAQSELSTIGDNEHEHYLAEIKRIRNEIAGFRPIESNIELPDDNYTALKSSSKTEGSKQRPVLPTNKSSANNNNNVNGSSSVTVAYKKAAAFY